MSKQQAELAPPVRKMRNKDIERFYQGLLMYGTLPENMPTKLNYAVNRNEAAFRPLIEAYRKAVRKLYDRYGERGRDGKKVYTGPNQLKLADPDAYNAAQEELDEMEVPIPEIFMFPFASLPDPFNPTVHQMISPMIGEPVAAAEGI